MRPHLSYMLPFNWQSELTIDTSLPFLHALVFEAGSVSDYSINKIGTPSNFFLGPFFIRSLYFRLLVQITENAHIYFQSLGQKAKNHPTLLLSSLQCKNSVLKLIMLSLYHFRVTK